MQTNMTYDQFAAEVKNAGLLGQFSTADLNLARRNPDKGMQILNFKIDAKNATTPEQLALANQGAEDVRKSEGYSGGADGGGFYMTGEKPTAGSFGYTADSVFQAAKDGGVYDQLSPEDMQLIQNSPDYGMGVVSGKMEAAKGNLEHGRNMAEQSRILGGGYTTNPDGSGYYKIGPSPNDYVAPSAPKYAGNRQGEVDDLWNQQKNYGDFSYDVEKPTFDSQYSDEMQRLLSEILNREDFSYNAASDPLYSQYKKQYLREGERASADALGAAAAATGGIPSSYAATAAAQAGNYYAAQLTDKIPELYQLAYNKYLNDAQMDQTNLRLLGDMDDRDYSRYMDDVNQWNKDRSFAYGVYGDKYNRLADLTETARSLEETDYSRYLDDVNQYNADRKFGYGPHIDEVNYQTNERDKALAEAIRQQEYKDMKEEQQYNRAWNEEEKEYTRAWNEKAYADGRADTVVEAQYRNDALALDKQNANFDRLYTVAKLAYETGDMNAYRAAMQELYGMEGAGITSAPVSASAAAVGGTPDISDGNRSGTESDAQPVSTHYDAALSRYEGGAVPTTEEWSTLIKVFGTEDRVLAAGFKKGF